MTASATPVDRDAEFVRLFKHDPEALVTMADAVCRSVHGDRIFVRGLLEFSNVCAMDCAYCGIRRSNLSVRRYRMSDDEIVACALGAFERGIRTFVLQGGEDGSFSDGFLAGVLARIKSGTRGQAAITLSVGIRSRASYLRLRDAGADRYLMRFETSDPAIYARLKGGERLERRLDAIRTLKDLGFETGSGFMTGLPGETDDTVIANAFLCRELRLDMVGIGPFIPHADTPLGGETGSSIGLAVKAVALTRLLLPRAHMPATTAAGSLDPHGRELMFKAGANVIMPNITPVEHKKDYLLYPGKICIDEDYLKCLGCLSGRAALAGKRLDLSIASALREASA